MINIELFRVKVFPSLQKDLFPVEFSPPLALVAAIQSTPSAERRKGYTWHIGNVESIDPFGMYFALGRTTITTKALYDEAEHKFAVVADETAPFTHVFCDTALEVCGIAAQHELAPSVGGIAHQLEELLNSTVSKSTGYRFEVSAIRDPTDFLEIIQRAYAVMRFAVTFSLPNAFDAKEDLQAPVERYAKEARARKGILQVSGPDLNKTVVETVARAAAAGGNEATAVIRTTKKAKPVKRSIKGNPASLKESDDVTSNQQKRSILDGVRNLYGRIKRGDGA